MRTTEILDSHIAYREEGSGETPFLFLHGNPTSSYLWRKVIPTVARRTRCLAPDLIGMGESGKPPIDYRFRDHARYLDAWIDALGLDGLVLVGHDWGGALSFDWAFRHPDRVKGVVFLETILRPMAWSDFPESARPVFQALRTPGVGERMALEENIFIERALPGTVRNLSEKDHAVYRGPYPTPESRRPLLQWPREMPLDGEPADTAARIEAYGAWLAQSPDVPKLLMAFDPGPGIMIGPEMAAWCAENISSLEVARCGPAGHHAPEDQPEAIAEAIIDWAVRHGLFN